MKKLVKSLRRPLAGLLLVCMIVSLLGSALPAMAAELSSLTDKMLSGLTRGNFYYSDDDGYWSDDDGYWSDDDGYWSDDNGYWTDDNADEEDDDSYKPGVAYKLGMDKGDGTVLYFNGETESASVNYRLATTTNVDEAVNVYLEEVPGGYHLYFIDGSTKTYIRVYHRTDGNPGFGKGSLELVTTAPSEYYVYDGVADTLIYDHESSNAYYMGTYGTFTTFSVSNTYYITGNNAANVDVSQFPARLYKVDASTPDVSEPVATEPETTTPVVSDTLQTGVAYKLGIDQINKGKIYYFTGEMSGYYGNSSDSWDAAVDVYLEEAVGGHYLSFINASGAKKYLNLVQSGTYNNFTIADSASTVYVFDGEYNTLVTVVGEETYYIGTYGSYETFGFSKYSYIATSFPAHLYEVGEEAPDVTEPTTSEPETEPVATEPETTVPAVSDGLQTGVPYKLGIDQLNKGSIYYFTGEMTGYYGASSENWDDGVEVILEEAVGGYYLSFTNSTGAKKYINIVQSGTYVNFTIADSASTVYVFDAEYNTMVTVLGEQTYYMGTYNNFVTFGFSKYSYIATSFPAHLYEVGEEAPDVTEPTEPVTQPETTAPAANGIFQIGLDGYENYDEANEVLSYVNSYRAEVGAAPLKMEPALMELAMLRAAEISVFYSHTRPNNTSCGTVFNGTIFQNRSWGENIAIGQADAAEVSNDWYNSPGHYANMTQTAFKSIGIGCFYQEDGTRCWIQLFSDVTTSSQNTNSGVKTVSNIPIEASTVNVSLSVDPLSDCGVVELYAGQQVPLQVTAVNKGFTYKTAILSGNYSVTSANNAVAKVNSTSLIGVTAGSTEAHINLDGLTLSVPVEVKPKPVISCETDEYDQTVITWDASNDDLVLFYKSESEDQWSYAGNSGKFAPGFALDSETYYFVLRIWNGQEYVDISDILTIESDEEIDVPFKTGVAYKLGIDQTNKGEIYYFTGEMSGYYGASETSMDTAADVYVETAPGGYYLTFKDASGAKKYITMVQSGTHYNFTIADSASTVYTYDAQYNTFVTELDGGSFYMGTYNNFVTFGFSKYTYIATSFPARLYEVGEEAPDITEPTEPATSPTVSDDTVVVSNPKSGVAYKLGMNNGSAKYYFTGAMQGYYGATTTNTVDAVDVYLEAVSDGYYLYFKDGSIKTYIYIYEYIPTGSQFPRGSFGITTDKPETCFTYDSSANTLIATFGDNSYYMGTYGTYTTISASSTYYIEGSNAANVDISQFPARLYEVGENDPELSEPTTEPLEIISQPNSKSIEAGATAQFEITATGKGLTYQWQYRTSSTGSWKNASATGNEIATLSVLGTCTNNGYQYRCKVTDAYGKVIYSNVVSLKVVGHSYETMVTEPDCENDGYTTYFCVDCGDSYESDYVAAWGHKWREDPESYAPTCVTEGYLRHFCTVCGDETVEILPANGHTEEAVPAIAPTCTETGLTEGSHCATCGEVIVAQEEIPALGHSYNAVVTKPDCENGGYTTYTCSACGDSYVADYTNALGHTAVTDAAVAPTCTETGLTEGSHCAVCGEVIVAQIEISALGHSYNAVVTKPDCENGGYTTYTCSACGDSYVSNYTSALGHSYNAVVTKPDCENGGYTTYTCSACGDSYVADYTNALGHAAVTDAAVAPTCTETGLTEGSHCAVCGEVIVAQEELSELGHSYNAVVTKPDCENSGYTTYTCSACGDSYVADYTNALGHSYNAVVTEPDCENSGYTTYTCSTCGDSYVADYTNALGHNVHNGICTDCGTVFIKINTQPGNHTVKEGITAKYTVKATGEGLNYQWQYRASSSGSWKNASATGNKTKTLSVPATASKHGYQYRCRLTDENGNTIYTKTVNLYVLGIKTQPVHKTVKAGTTAKFTVSATGSNVTYQWQYRTSSKGSWKNASATGNKTATLSISATTSHHGYQYRCRITDSAGNMTYTNTVNLNVLGIKTQPNHKTLVAGKTAKFTVSATGSNVTYQWQYRTSSKGSWKNASATGSKTKTLSVPATVARHSYQYRCKITDAAGNVVYTNAVNLYVLGIKTQPAHKTVRVGATAKFTVTAVGNGLTYQWQYKTSSKGDWKNASATGSKTKTLSVPATSSKNGYQYRCKITDSFGNVTYTNAVKLTVKK